MQSASCRGEGLDKGDGNGCIFMVKQLTYVPKS